MKLPFRMKILFLILICNFLFLLNPLRVDISLASIQSSSSYLLNEQDIAYSEFNNYYPDGNISILVALDSNLLGEDKFFTDYSSVKNVFEYWLTPLEKLFNISFHVYNVAMFTPGENDSLDISIEKVANDLSWIFSDGINDPSVNGNNNDFLVIYQRDYRGGRNRVNAIYGNTLIIAHNQILDWTSRQLILLHEVGHIFGGVHYEYGYIPPEWYGTASRTIMSYDDLAYLKFSEWDKDQLPMDNHNFEIINSSKYRFDQNDADLDELPNYYEYRYGMNPCLDETYLDLDDDGLNDLEEFRLGTHPLMGDSDTDAFSDWAENLLNTSPINSSEYPILTTPIVITWSTNQEITANQNITIRWRGVAANKDKYTIYQNDTLLINSEWTQELISYKITGLKPGKWVFNCIVTDLNGNSANASMIIIIPKEDKVSAEAVFSLLAITVFIFLKRFKDR
jgi:hypothetical protein